MEDNHLYQFNGKCSALVPESTYINYMEGKNNIGYRPDANDPKGSMYVSRPSDIDYALEISKGDISKVEKTLGLQPGHFKDEPLIRIDINNPEKHGLRMANGREAGANEFYNTPLDENGKLPNIQYADADHKIVDTNKTDPVELAKLNGQHWDQDGKYHAPNADGYAGKTSGGLDEAVVNQIPNTPDNISYTKIDGFHRGESGELNCTSITDGYSENLSGNNLGGNGSANPNDCNVAIPKTNPAASASPSGVDAMSPSTNNGMKL